MEMRRVWPLLRAAAGIALLAVVVSGSDWRLLGRLFARPLVIAAVVGLPFLGSAVEAVRLGVLCRGLALRLPFRVGFQIVAISGLFNFVIPGATGGDLAKIWFLRSIAKGDASAIAALWFVDRLTGLVSLLVLVSIVGLTNLTFAGSHPALGWLLGGAIALLVAIAGGLLILPTLTPFFMRRLTRWARLHAIAARAIDAVIQYRHHAGAVWMAMAISMVGHLALLATFVAVGRVLTPALGTGRVALLSLFGLFANALPVTPGGLGVGETAFDVLFHLAGADGGASLLLTWRIGMMPLCLVGALFYTLGIRHRLDPVAGSSQPAPAAVR